MKKNILLAALCILFLTSAMAQNNVGVGTTTPNASAALDVQSTTQGMLIPRMTQTERDAISSPATGLLVYQTDGIAGLYIYNGTAWASTSQLEKITENGKTGFRILGRDPAKFGDIGTDAIDLTFNQNASTTMGATGDRSIAMGRSTTASGINSTAMGFATTASNTYSTAMGYFTTASAIYSTAMGSNTTASGNNSTAMGNYTTAPAFCEFTIGQYNTEPASPNATTWSGSNRVFTIGNGGASISKADAMIVFKSGNVTIAGALTQSSDARLKTNIASIPNALGMVNKLKGVYYDWKEDKNRGRQVGFIAQDIQKVLPEAVTGKEGDMQKGEILSVAYSAVTPVLVEAIKELSAENEVLKKENAALKAQLSGFADRLGNIEKALNAENNNVGNKAKTSTKK